MKIISTKLLFVLILLHFIVFSGCNNKKEDDECQIEDISSEIKISGSSTFIAGISFELPIEFVLHGTCSQTDSFSSVLVIEKMDTPSFVNRDTFRIAGFNGTKTLSEKFSFSFVTLGQYVFRVECVDVFNEIKEQYETTCQ